MDNKTLWLEVDKTNQAVLSYFLEQPTTPSDKFDYVQVTQDELTYLSALEDAVFPAGMVATLSDLTAHRTRVQAATKAKATSPAKPAAKAPQQPSKTANKPGNTSPSTSKESALASLKGSIKQHRNRK